MGTLETYLKDALDLITPTVAREPFPMIREVRVLWANTLSALLAMDEIEAGGKLTCLTC